MPVAPLLMLATALADIPVGMIGMVALDRHDVVLADIADLSALRPDQVRAVRDLVVLRLPHGGETLITPAQLAVLAHRRVPGLRFRAAQNGPIRFVVHAASHLQQRCSIARAPLESGHHLVASDLQSRPCADRGTRPNGIARDAATGDLVLTHAVAAGTDLGPIVLPAAPAVRPGDRLVLHIRQGAARIERPVVAVQQGRAGARLFVRDADGEVHSAYMASEPERGE